MSPLSTELQPKCIAQRLNLDCLALIFHEDVLAEDQLGLYDSNWAWPETRNIFLRHTMEKAQTKKARALIRLSHVCRRWREVALSLSSLWTTLVAQHRHWYFHDAYETIMERTRGLPLSYILPDDLIGDFMEKQLVENLSRYETIMFCTEYSEWSSFFSGKTASILRNAVFITEDYEHPEPQDAQELDPVHMPVATHLALDGLYVPFTAPQLTHLAISLQRARLSARHICDILLQTPLLESLSLVQYIPAAPEGWPLDKVDELRGIPLLHLNYLKVWGSPLDVSSFLHCLDVPKDVSLEVSTYEFSDHREFTQLVDALQPYMAQPMYDTLAVCDCHVVAEGLEDDPPFFSLRECLNGPRKLTIRIDSGSGAIMALHQLAVARLMSGQIHNMVIEEWESDMGPMYTPSGAADAFHSDALNNMEELRYVTRQITAYSSSYPSRWGWGNGLLPDFILHHPDKYPFLRRISVRGGSSDRNSWPPGPHLLGMKAWLDSRVQAGNPLESLQLEGQIPEGAPTSLDELGDGVTVLDKRHIVPPPPVRTITTSFNSPPSSDDDEFYSLFARYNTFP